MHNLKINLIIQRLQLFFDVKTSKALAQKLGVSESALSNWKNRNTIDYELLFTKCEGINFNWLFLGKGEMNSLPEQVNESPPGYARVIGDANEKLVRSQQETIEVQRRYINSLEKDLAKLRQEKELAEGGQKRKAV
jgi:transcriptional regulator with XRE-family HTH domain